MKDAPSRSLMGWRKSECRAISLVLLLLLLAMPVKAQTDQPLQLDVGRSVIDLNAGEARDVQFTVSSGSVAILSWTCSSCQLEVDEHDDNLAVEAHGTTMLSVQANQTDTPTLTLSAEGSEAVELLLFNQIGTTMNTQRPAPGAATDHVAPAVCTSANACLTATDHHLFSVPELNQATTSGVVEANAYHHVVFNASSGDTLEWQWLATTEAVSVEMFHQTETSETLTDTDLNAGASTVWSATTPLGAHWVAPTDGRFIARIATQAPVAFWAAHVVLHHHEPVHSLMESNLTSGTEIIGHGNITAPFAWDETQELSVEAVHHPVVFSVDQLLNGAWVAGSPHTLQPGEPMKVYPYPDVSAGRMKVTGATAFMLEASTRSYADLDGLEAPSYRPTDNATNNATWPVINLTEPTSGELTLAVHDTTDTYRLVVDGWSESIHFVQFVVEGDVADLEIQLWDIDQNTGEVLATDITRPVGEQLRIGLQVGRGTHYLQLRFQNASEATPHLWGEDVASRSYTLRPAYTLIDEGDEPWFPPSEDAVFWGGVARWFMGLLFLLPAVYLFIHVKRSQAFAASVAEKKERLSWYISRLDSGESSPKQARIDMSKALRAVAELDWNEGLEAWGPKRLEHRTEDVALAIWSVDERLATKEQAWPVVVGVHVLNGTWDLAALRFDAPQGQGFEVVHVEPRFLFQGEEVFLDTMGPGHRTYLIVELAGPAQHVDVELNGRMDGQPFAARVPETLER